tara:strand:+ start:286 stop:906 length:621 start_codon:yes stop_codon:yes gene_type:complete
MGNCCEPQVFTGLSKGYKRALIAVILINAVMFFVEMAAGFSSQSQALKADALDFAGDSVTYAISLAVIGAAIRTRALASLFKGASLGLMALVILVTTGLRFIEGGAPEAHTMGLIGALAFLANMASVLILLKWRDGDSNVRSVWLCSRNDAIGNIGVILAGFAVAFTGSAWPDLIVAGLMAAIFLKSAASITAQARAELKQTKSTA